MKITTDKEATWFIIGAMAIILFGICFSALLYIEYTQTQRVIRLEFGMPQQKTELATPGVLRGDWPTKPKLKQMN